jgi:oligopeptide transport system ATP-binding protein
MNPEVLLDVQDLKKHYPIRNSLFGSAARFARVVDGVSFQIRRGETLGLVGETGSGKTVLLRTLLYLERPTSGIVHFEGQDLGTLSKDEMKAVRRDIQMIFQDSVGSLHPRLSIEENLLIPVRAHKIGSRNQRVERVKEVMELVGLDPDFRSRYPHQLSGGQRQRVGIARALMLRPKLIVCDEPISSLDVSLQAQVLNLFMDLRDELSLTYLFVAHDLAVLRQISNWIAIMYLGRIVEFGSNEDIYSRPKHPYTNALLLSSPSIAKGLAGQRVSTEMVLGEVPNAKRPPSGCTFHTRCKHAFDHCSREIPILTETEAGHQAACFLINSDVPKV